MSKLTLSMDPEVIKQAKSYAASQQQSLSKLIESYLKTLPHTPERSESEVPLTGLVAELAGVIKDHSQADEGADYIEYLQEKYQ